MQTLYPERIVAIWFRSGTAFATWEKGEIPRPEIPAAAYTIPFMCNPGAKENGDARFRGAWDGTLAMSAPTAVRAHRADLRPIRGPDMNVATLAIWRSLSLMPAWRSGFPTLGPPNRSSNPSTRLKPGMPIRWATPPDRLANTREMSPKRPGSPMRGWPAPGWNT
jgi:hypothetical protein